MLALGTFAVISIMTASAINDVPSAETMPDKISLATTLALLVGLVQVGDLEVNILGLLLLASLVFSTAWFSNCLLDRTFH